MTPEQKQTLLDFIEDTAYGVDFFNIEARKAAAAMKADLAAMLQKITPEALVKAGWKQSGSLGQYFWHPCGAVCVAFVGAGFEVRAYDYAGRIRVPGVTTMYQLDQLADLLGGAK